MLLRLTFFISFILFSAIALGKTKVEYFTTSDSVKIGYLQLGDRLSPQLIFIHGGPGDNSSDFRSMANRLSKKFNVIVFDSRGCGFSQRGLKNSQLTIEKMVNDVKELQDHLGLKSTIVLGHSYGGAVAIEFSLLYPDRIRKLVLCAPVTSASKAQKNRMESGYDDGLKEGDSTKIDIYQCYMRGGSISIQQEAAMISLSHSWYDPSILDSVYTSIKPRKLGYNKSTIETAFYIVMGYFETGFFPNYENLSRAHLIKNETVIITGKYDQLISLEDMKELHSRIGKSQLKVVDESGHFPYIEQPDEFCGIMESLLN